MDWTRREFGIAALSGLLGLRWLVDPRRAFVASTAATGVQRGGRFGGVEIGMISYSFRQISYKAEDVIKGMQFLGLSVLELEQAFFEEGLGAPRDPTGGGRPALAGSEVAGGPFGSEPARHSNAGGGRGGPPNDEADPARKALRDSAPRRLLVGGSTPARIPSSRFLAMAVPVQCSSCGRCLSKTRTAL